MKKRSFCKALSALRKLSPFFALSVAAVVCICLLSAGKADALYILTGDNVSAIVLDNAADRAAVRDLSSQLVYFEAANDGRDMMLESGQTVAVRFDNAVITIPTQGETVSDLLGRLNIHPAETDTILVDLSGGRVTLQVAAELTFRDQVVEEVPYETVRKSTPNLPLGQERVVQAGVNGTRTSIYEVTYSNGELLSRTFVEELECTTVNEIIEVGTAVSTVSSSDRVSNVTKNTDGSGVLTFRSGGTMKFSGVKAMTATAYTAGSGGADSCTATGTTVRVGTVAVDKRVIPLGTKMYIVTNDGSYIYGVAVAEDTGVRGKVIDLYFDTYSQCIRFGRRACTVYLLG